ncbi:MAG: GNAT family N-acetyltransferase [Bacteroidota bacterium]
MDLASPTQEFSVSQASVADLDDLARLFDAYRQFYRQDADLDGARLFLRARLDGEESVILTARAAEQGEAVGFTQLYPFFSSVRMRRLWVLNDLFVAASARRMGVARALIEAAHAFAAETGAAGVQLSTERTNHAAQALYNDLGYVRDDDFWTYEFSPKT